MAPASNEEQFKFLISCIRYSNNGKVDFAQVAKECKIVSKGAAAKRYERMMRAHGIASSSPAATVKPPRASSSVPKPDMSSTSSRSNHSRASSSNNPGKKRKVLGSDYLDSQTGDDDEGLAFSAGVIKNESAMGRSIHSQSSGTRGRMDSTMRSSPSDRDIDSKESLRFTIKEEVGRISSQEEQSQGLSMNEAVNLMRFYDSPISYNDLGLNDESLGAGNNYTLGGSGRDGGYSTSFGMHTPSQQVYQFAAGYGGANGGEYGRGSVVPKSEGYSGGYSGALMAASQRERKDQVLAQGQGQGRGNELHHQGLHYTNEDSPLIVD